MTIIPFVGVDSSVLLRYEFLPHLIGPLPRVYVNDAEKRCPVQDVFNPILKFARDQSVEISIGLLKKKFHKFFSRSRSGVDDNLTVIETMALLINNFSLTPPEDDTDDTDDDTNEAKVRRCGSPKSRVSSVLDEFGIDFNMQYLKWLTAQTPLIAGVNPEGLTINEANIRKYKIHQIIQTTGDVKAWDNVIVGQVVYVVV